MDSINPYLNWLTGFTINDAIECTTLLSHLSQEKGLPSSFCRRSDRAAQTEGDLQLPVLRDGRGGEWDQREVFQADIRVVS